MFKNELQELPRMNILAVFSCCICVKIMNASDAGCTVISCSLFFSCYQNSEVLMWDIHGEHDKISKYLVRTLQQILK